MTVGDTDKVYKIETSSFYSAMSKKDLINDIEKNKHKICYVYEKNGEAVGFYICLLYTSDAADDCCRV